MSLLLVFLLSFAVIPALSFSYPETAEAATSLNVYVGYAGGPYYLKASYSASELESLADDAIYYYSGIDGGGVS